MHAESKKSESEDKAKDISDKSLEKLHREFFTHPSDEEWNATRSLAQPSFLRQVNSRGGAHSKPLKNSSAIHEKHRQ